MHAFIRKTAVLVFLSSALIACATEPATPIAAAPTCSGQADCDYKWGVARSFVLAHAAFKFQTYTPDFMETYSPTNASAQLAARVNREPIGEGAYKITAVFYCDNPLGCVPSSRQTLNDFNLAVGAAKAQ